MSGIQEWLSFYFKSPQQPAERRPEARPVHSADQASRTPSAGSWARTDHAPRRGILPRASLRPFASPAPHPLPRPRAGSRACLIRPPHLLWTVRAGWISAFGDLCVTPRGGRGRESEAASANLRPSPGFPLSRGRWRDGLVGGGLRGRYGGGCGSDWRLKCGAASLFRRRARCRRSVTRMTQLCASGSLDCTHQGAVPASPPRPLWCCGAGPLARLLLVDGKDVPSRSSPGRDRAATLGEYTAEARHKVFRPILGA